MSFEYIRPRNLSEALDILSRADEQIRILAGGTGILVNIREGLESPQLLVDIGTLDGLKTIQETDSQIEIGALVTHAQAVDSSLLQQKALPLVQGCSEIGSPQIRSRGTIGGNLVTASPAGDCIPPLYVLGAVVSLKSLNDERQVPIESLFTGVKKTVIRPDELLMKIGLPTSSMRQVGFFRKLGQRKALAISKVSVAARLRLDGLRITNASLSLGAVAPTVVRALKTELFLKGQGLNRKVISRAAELIQTESKAITDIRSTAEYRNEMVGVLLARGLEEILEGT